MFVLLAGSSTSLLIILTMTWIAAWRTGALPNAEAWRHYEQTGNGPWDHSSTMLAYVDFVFLSAAMTLASGGITIFLAPSAGRQWFGGFMSAVAAGTMWYHFLLID